MSEITGLSIVLTADGSKTIYHPMIKENYHSRNGALQESNHVFLNSGLRYYLADKIVDQVSVLEVGFGTGLNYLLTHDFCTGKQINLNYVGLEAFPLSFDLIDQTDYKELVSTNTWAGFKNNYEVSKQKSIPLNEFCCLQIVCEDAKGFKTNQLFDVIYFDAFASNNQPELWTKDFITQIVSFLKPNGVFVTYAITGDLKRIMKGLGMKVEKAPGAAGKREMLRAIKFLF
ncbi:tRNA (5-methylaminomethyl-2-thiouridine)(34)-methyltransferase MnmD [Pedobacter sp. SD-b]|uniref:tRNA (5-methylaminomethyl-2-thiouridine)(34)-methyltransferase MnmD n=1 Tax=Pedobacter segetis TaxID=2793069 RepID=A0ABS1BL24_9SPHI|nr:tRNA (5-methylaminomethyl-2-thiouridine)(34)-methyltransferase MnmD [Pedobacter segetis]MBK0383498.1 tRNA (5-methylaminomethyl-2-thiouridine)(34)-methyltransferase MnmD [Pedobacter segetis]